MTKLEEDKLFKLIEEAYCAADARLYRIMECSAFCVESKGCFCGGFEKRRRH